MSAARRWNDCEVKRALYLYFQLPFGQIHSGNAEIISLAGELERTPSSVAMKLANFASLDPKIQASGRRGLQGASELDRKIWEEFHDNWTKLIVEADKVEGPGRLTPNDRVREAALNLRYEPPGGVTSIRGEIEHRVGQAFFRRAVLANFDNTCCVTGIAEPSLLIASHISSWKSDHSNRHNPRNGLCFSATFDRAFDRYLMTVTTDLVVRLSGKLLKSKSVRTRNHFLPYEGQKLRMPTHLMPDESLISMHNERFTP